MRYLLLLLAATGCYSYTPLATSATPKVGERLRVELTPEGTTEMARYLGPRVIEAEGSLMSVAADRAMVVAVDFVQMVDGMRMPWSGEGVVTFPPNLVAGTRGRTFEKRRTIVATTAAVAALVTTAVIAIRSGRASGGGEVPPPPPP
jgi:hypothetical protein